MLGTRYVYDAVGDPVYMVELLRVIHEGDNEADLSRGEKSMTVQGSGIVLVSNAAGETMRVVRAHRPVGRRWRQQARRPDRPPQPLQGRSTSPVSA